MSPQEGALESAMAYAVETELSLRVRQWEHRIRPILEEEVCPKNKLVLTIKYL